MALHIGMSTYDATAGPIDMTPKRMLEKLEADLYTVFAARGASMGDEFVYLVPEFYFSRCQGHQQGTRQLDEMERDQVIAGLKEISAAHPDCLILAGTILWYSYTPFFKTVTVKGLFGGTSYKTTEEECFDVLNQAVVLYRGEVVKRYFKQLDGGEIIKYDAHLLKDFWKTKKFHAAKVNLATSAMAPKDLAAPFDELKKEGLLRYQPPVDRGAFSWRNRACGIEICQDHQQAMLLNSCGSQLDMHFLLSNITSSVAKHIAARSGGLFVHCEAGKWRSKSLSPLHVVVREADGQLTDLTASGIKARDDAADALWYWQL